MTHLFVVFFFKYLRISSQCSTGMLEKNSEPISWVDMTKKNGYWTSIKGFGARNPDRTKVENQTNRMKPRFWTKVPRHNIHVIAFENIMTLYSVSVFSKSFIALVYLYILLFVLFFIHIHVFCIFIFMFSFLRLKESYLFQDQAPQYSLCLTLHLYSPYPCSSHRRITVLSLKVRHIWKEHLHVSMINCDSEKKIKS